VRLRFDFDSPRLLSFFFFFINLNFSHFSLDLFLSYIFEVALEICSIGDGEESTLAHSGDLWVTIMRMTQNTNKRKSLDPPSSDTPHVWDDFVKHTALANLLDSSVAHKDLQLRKTYIERIIDLPSGTQRSLMSLIERRKKRGKTPKKDRSSKKRSKATQQTPSAAAYTSNPDSTSMSKGSPKVDFRSPFSPLAESLSMVKRLPASGTKSQRKSRGRGLFASPLCLNKMGPRRSFEEAFGTPTLPSPSPKRVPVAADQSFFSPGLGDTAEYEKEVQSLREEKEELGLKLEKSEQKEQDLVQKLEDVEANFLKEMMKIEAEARFREDQTKEQYESRLTALQIELENVNEQYADAERAKTELAGVKDELELMLHTKSMLAETTERLRNYKEKLQQMTDVKEALQREEVAHSKSVDECLRLDNELAALQPLKRQLEEYKTRAVDSEVRFTDCQDELLKLKQQRFASTDNNQNLEHSVLSQQEEIEELRSRLSQNDTANQEASGIGDGLSELNPELKEEVFRLRNENKQLREFAGKRDNDAVCKLEQNLEDTSRLSERYKSQFLSTKDQLETTQGDLQASRDREARLRNDVSEAMEKIKITQAQVEEVSQQLFMYTDHLNASRARESNLEQELSSWMDQTKELQEKTNDLSTRLQTCSNELEASQAREGDLHQDVSDWKEKLEATQQQANDLSDQLSIYSQDLKISQQSEMDLKAEIAHWTTQTESSQEEARDLTDKLSQTLSELTSARESETYLKKELAEETSKAKESEERGQDLTAQRDKCADELDETRQALLKSQEQEENLQNELVDMTSRAEDSETVSKQRMELVQSTREKLKTARAQVDELKKTESALSSDVEAWTEKTEAAETKIKQAHQELEESNNHLNDTREKLSEAEAQVLNLATRVQNQFADIEEWKDKTQSTENLTDRLQEELKQIGEILSTTQSSLKTSQDDQALMKEGFAHAEHMLFELEQEVETEKKARKGAEEQLESARADISKTQQKLNTLKTKLTARIEEETQTSNKYKQDLFHTQETLNETQGSLGASQHREKMLKHEVTKLKDTQVDLETELKNASKKADEATEESSKSLDATREVLNAKAQKGVEEVQFNMNLLLEDERKAKRQSHEAYKQKLQQMRGDFDKELADVRKKAETTVGGSHKEAEERMGHLKNQYEKKLAELKASADEQNDKLLAKGKGMLKDVRFKATEEIDSLKENFAAIEEKLDHEKKEKERIILQAKAKVTEYKKKLQFTTGRINTLSADSDELDEKVSSLEREKFKLQEENDRYRRQLGGRFGPDSKVQSQLDLLQKEFKNAMEETRELRRQLKTQNGGSGFLNALPSINENAEGETHSYSRNAVNQSTLVQLRSEYEETIEALNDEKRELVMKNSAAITDVQKAEKRAWESEQDNASMQQELTSLKLQVERLEHLLTNIDEAPSQGSDDMVMGNLSEVSSIPKPPEPGTTAVDYSDDLSHAVESDIEEEANRVLAPNQALSNGVASTDMVVKSPGKIDFPRAVQHIAGAQQVFPSLAELQQGKSPGQDAPPECKQC
jgi:chromosome segregation ATPase